ncbi:MAG: lysylphosphatidylglycerol synthase transmembrane domain-containing protein [Cyanophyceae cyanobacterium]
MLVKNLLYSIFSLILGLFLVWLILYLTPVDAEQVLVSLKSINPIYAGLVLLSTFVHLWLTAYKWKLITQKLTSEQKQPQKFYLAYITVACLTIQFVPQHIGMLIVQSFAMKFHKISTLSRGFFGIIYDQFFNLLIPLVLLLPSLLFLFNYLSLSAAIFVSISSVVIAHSVLKKWQKTLVLWLVQGYYTVQKLVRKKAQPVNDIQLPVLGARFTSRLFWISALRHANWVLRGFLIAMAGGLSIQFWAIAFAVPVIQLAMIISFTPANLGFMEWGWIGVLGLLQVSTVEAVSFALLQRILGLSSLLLITLGLSLSLGMERAKTDPNKLL